MSSDGGGSNRVVLKRNPAQLQAFQLICALRCFTTRFILEHKILED